MPEYAIGGNVSIPKRDTWIFQQIAVTIYHAILKNTINTSSVPPVKKAALQSS
jgi:hypothetical protein